MNKSTRITGLLALLLALPAYAQAATDAPIPPPSQDQGSQTTDALSNPTGDVTGLPVATDVQPAAASPSLDSQASEAGLDVDRVGVQRASDLIGMRVENRAGKKLGDISDLAIEPQTGQIAYAALLINDVLGFGGKLIAIPLSALTLQPASDRAILDTSEAALDQAPGFDAENWPKQANMQWLDADTAIATEGTQASPEATAHTRMASQAAEIVITNPMPHPMNVMADWGQGSQNLGSVQPNETRNFEITAPADAQVRLTATDEAQTHSPSGTVTLDPDNPATWTIQ